MIEIDEQELWRIAMFRLREAARRIQALRTVSEVPQTRKQLLRIYERLLAGEESLGALAGRAARPARELDRPAATARR